MNRLAVVIPCYNKVFYTQKTIESLITCTKADWYIIIVDDNSTDETRAYAMELMKRYNNGVQKVYYHKNETNIGVNAAWNCGLRIAMALGVEHICIANNDLMLTDGWDTPLINALDNDGYYLVSPYSTEQSLPPDFPQGNNRHTNPVSSEMGILGACFMFKPELVNIIGYFPEAMKHYFGDNWIQDQTKMRKLKTGHIYASYIHHFFCITSVELDNKHWFHEDGRAFQDYCNNFKLPQQVII